MTFYSNVKQKSYVLNPRGKPLYEDANRFGTKMLEKMGWSKGKGLGMNEDGEQNFIRVSHKTDQKGMGYQDRDDQWTGHENKFNSLLESLDNSANVSPNVSINEESNEVASTFGLGFGSLEEKKNKKSKSVKLELSGKSLEEMSRKSSVRVHYRKFTRSKDISKYSEKDLANIFGKKCVNDHNNETQAEQAGPTIDLFETIHTIETGGTIQQYFKKKKNEPSKRNKDKSDESNEDQQSTTEQNPEKKRRKKDKKSKPDITVSEEVGIVRSDESQQLKQEKKKKKSKKETVALQQIVISDDNTDCEIVSIKIKKNKKKLDESQPEGIDVAEIEKNSANVNCFDSLENSEDKLSKKKKRDKKDSSNTTTSNMEVNINHSVPINNTGFIDGILTILVNNNSNSGHSLTELKQSNVNSDEDDEEMKSTNKTNQNIAMNEVRSVFEINRYHAEIFRFVDLDGFPGDSNLSDLSGYGYGKEFELKISEKSKDQNKINDLWDYALIHKYGKEVISQTSKTKRYSIKHLRKKNVFMKL